MSAAPTSGTTHTINIRQNPLPSASDVGTSPSGSRTKGLFALCRFERIRFMKKLSFAWAFLCAGFLSLLPASAVWSQPKAPPQPYVVLVGIDDYKDPQIVDRV